MIIFSSVSDSSMDRLNDLIATKMTADIDDGSDADILNTYDSRFPRWTLLTDPDKCVMAFRQLEQKALDYYNHIPSVLDRFILGRSIEDWIDFLEVPTPASIVVSESERIANASRDSIEAKDLRRFMGLVCPNPDLLYRVEGIINNALAGGKAYKDAGIELQEYFDIVPPDIRARLEGVQHPAQALP